LSAPIIATYGLLRLPLGAPPLRGAPAYRLRCYRALRVGSPQPSRRCRDGSLLFHDGLCDRSVPHRPAGSWVLRFQGLGTVHGLRPCGQGSAPACFPLSRGGLRPGRIPRRTDRSLACRPRRRCRGASTVGSPLPPATSYGAAWPLPRPDSHRQVHRSFQDTPHTTHLEMSNGLPDGFCRPMQLLPGTPVDQTNQATDDPAPWLHPHRARQELPRYYGPVRRRVPRRYSSPLRVQPAWDTPSRLPTRGGSIGTRLPTFRARAQTRLTSPTCRTPPGQ